MKQLRAQLGLPAPDFLQEVPAGLLLTAVGRGVIQRDLDERLQNLTPEQKQAIVLDLRGGRPTDNPRPNGGIGYKARPLNGIWATAPFLHNGSVPNLYQLLLPDDQRVKSFYVGSREFDPVNVGFQVDEFAGGFQFRTEAEDGQPIPGNSNAGHSGKFYTQTMGDDGSFRDFSDEERSALVEYMKTLK